MSDVTATPSRPAETADDVLRDILERLDVSDRFVAAQLELLPLTGPNQPTVKPQVRQRSSKALSVDGLQGLSMSIRSVGQLQPIIVERMPDGADVLVAGQRRLAAMQLGIQADPDNPHLKKGVRALVVEGPLGPYERRAVQIAENLERRDLSSPDKGRALWMARTSLLRDRMVAAGADVPDWDELMADRVRDQPTAGDDPVERFLVLTAWKEANAPELHNVGANWGDAAATLGMDYAEETARDYARQYRDLGEARMQDLTDMGATYRTMRAARDLARQGLGGAVDEINQRVAQLVGSSNGDGPPADQLMHDAYALLGDVDDVDQVDVDDVVAQVATERGLTRPAMDEDDRDGDDVVRATPVVPDRPLEPRWVDVSKLLGRIRDVNRDADVRVRPWLDQATAEVRDGGDIKPDDRESLLVSLDDLGDLIADIRELLGA